MIKNNKLKMIISSVIILLPIVIGLVLWDKLPNRIATHWNFNGVADGWSSKPFAIFFLPAIVLLVHWLCILASSLDKRNNGQNKKILGIVLWICPFVSLFGNGLIYASAMGINIDVALLSPIFVGIVFIIIGNYLPKTTQNRIIGIKIKWTLESEENWNATHRFCGKIWVVGGIAFIISAFLPKIAMVIIFFTLITLLIVIPFVYSYLFYKKHSK